MKYLLLILAVVMLSGCYKHTQTHGTGPFEKGMVVDKFQAQHFYALFGIIDISGQERIDIFVKMNPNCRITTEQNIIDWFVTTICYSLFGTRTVTFEFPVKSNSNRGRELIQKEKERQMRIKEAAIKRKKGR